MILKTRTRWFTLDLRAGSFPSRRTLRRYPIATPGFVPPPQYIQPGRPEAQEVILPPRARKEQAGLSL